MGTVGAGFSMSVDGFIAGPEGDMGRLFQWMFSGETDVTVTIGEEDLNLKVSGEDAERFEGGHAIGAIVSGRGMFDAASAWGGKHPMNVPVIVVTHNIPPEWANKESPFTFVTDGVESAIAQAKKIAGDKGIGVGGADIARQCLKAGLLDEIGIDLVPVLLGKGIPFFEYIGIEPVELETTKVSRAPGVIHLGFRIVK